MAEQDNVRKLETEKATLEYELEQVRQSLDNTMKQLEITQQTLKETGDAYEECIRIPFWVRVPGLAGRDDEALVNDVDLGPTLAEFAGVIPTRHVDGLSLVDRIKNPEAPWLTEAYTEYISPAMKGDQMIFRELRTATAAYIEYANGDRELYDLEKDPLQLDNLVNDPGYAQILKELLQQLQILEEK